MLRGIINRILNRKTGLIRQVISYDLKSASITEPIVVKLGEEDSYHIITGTQSGELFVVDETGELHWKFKASEDVSELEEMFLDSDLGNAINSTPCAFDINEDGKKEVIFGTEFGTVYALNNKGKKLWSFKADGAIRGRINVFDFNNDSKLEIVFGSMDEYLYFLDYKGKLIKKIYVGSEIESTPVFFKGLTVVGSNDGFIRAFNSSGKNEWTVTTGSKVNSEAITAKLSGGHEYLLAGSTDNFLYCIDEHGFIIWKFETEGSIYSKPVVEDLNGDGLPEIVFGSCDNRIYVLNEEGVLLWSFETDFWVVGSPLIMDIDSDKRNEIVLGSYDTQIYVLSAEGSYNMGFIPGISGIVHQEGNYSEMPLHDPGEIVGKKIWMLKTPGLIVGCCSIRNNLVVQTKDGQLIWVKHSQKI